MPSIPPNVIFMWHSTNLTIPTNWTEETSIADRFIKGHGDENPAVTGGAATHSHAGIAHSHAQTDSHTHAVVLATDNSSGTFGGTTNNNPITNPGHGHVSANIGGLSGGTANDTIPYPGLLDNNAPGHVRLIFIKAGVGAVFQVGMIGLWNSASPPSYWYQCDGTNSTPDLRNYFPRGVSSGGDANVALAGGNTHTHVLNHSHSTSHTHSGDSGTDNNHRDSQNAGGSGGNKVNQHSHTVHLYSQTVSTDTYSATLTSGAIEPPFKKLLPIRRNGGTTTPRGLIGIWLGSVASIPTGWKVCDGGLWEDGVTNTPDMRNYYLKFASNAGEIGATTQAGVTISLTHAHAASNSHSHSQSGTHTHTGYSDSVNADGPPGGNSSPATHSHSLSSVGNNSGTLTWASSTISAESVSNEPQYIRAAFIQLTRPRGGFLTIF